MNEPNCECHEAGYCVRYNRQMTDRMQEICRGDVLTPEKCEAYRQMWRGERKTGLGDVVHSVAKATGMDKVAKAVSKVTGKDCGCNERRKSLNERSLKSKPFQTSKEKPRFITTQQLAKDTIKLAETLPPDISRIAGISRSGLTPATLLAKLLHLPLDIIRPKSRDIISASNGWRLGNAEKEEGITLIVDDTMMTGNSYRIARPLAQSHYKDPQFAVIYWNPNAKATPCHYVRELKWPHLLEWNLFNSVLTPCCAFDMDGVICRDCPPKDNDDGPRYAKFLEEVRPKYLVRRTRIPLIVTARHEKYREQTMKWLEKWGIKCNQLVMRDRPISGDWALQVAAYKAESFREFLKRGTGPGPQMFIESCPIQSKEISRLTGGLVVCPTTGECFKP